MNDFVLDPAVADDSLPSGRAQTHALVSEIWMLVDYIAGSASQGLAKVQVANWDVPSAFFTVAELLQTVTDAERRAARGGQPHANDRAHMQIVRDSLNLLVRPASGLTIAYTTMVAGPLRRRDASRFNLARQAYENLADRARHHRVLQRVILVMAVLATGVAVWESAKVALGKALLQNLDMLRTQQASLGSEKVKQEMAHQMPADAQARFEGYTRLLNPPLESYRLCDRALVMLATAGKEDPQNPIQKAASDPKQLPPSYATAEERDVCGREDVLRANLGIVHNDLKTYSTNWPGMVGSGFAVIRNVAVCLLPPHCPDQPADAPASGGDDIEFKVAPLLLVWGNFILPIIFSLIGSSIFVTLDHYNKLRDSLLHPRDQSLAPVRLVLGLVVGACVGLFFSAYGPLPTHVATVSASQLVSSLTLTASGVAFLAGFGVETVFSMLQAAISRVFALPATAK